MIAVKVEYTVKPEYTEQNKANIRRVMEALQANPIDGMYYSAQVKDEEPNSFVHINMAENAEVMSKLSELESFKSFQKELKASEPVSPPKAVKMTVIGKGF